MLGLKLVSENKYAIEFDANGTLLRITVVEKLKPHPFTILGWKLDNNLLTFGQGLQNKNAQ